jgi:catechol 2,3-dioxygenase-like lactoylglutathione lyase family enzyme
MVETQGLTHINLLVADVHRAKTFYERVFGLQELFWDGPGMVFLRPPGTQDTITLQQSPNASRGPGTSTISGSVWPSGANWTGRLRK